MMCGRYNVVDSPQVRALFASLGVELPPGFRFSPDISPGSCISIVRRTGEHALVSDAIWWLILDPATVKPTKYTSFNSRSDRLNDPKAFAFRPFRESRCVIPASAFIEGLGDGKTYHKIVLQDKAIAFGGIYREWINRETGETTLSASIITLPTVDTEQWRSIHPKSIPLMLGSEPDLLSRWLNPDENDVSQFDDLLVPGLRNSVVVTPIGKVSQWNEIGPGRVISGEP